VVTTPLGFDDVPDVKAIEAKSSGALTGCTSDVSG
jgi:hypothetical protein